MTALYFKSRKNFQDKSTWGKEALPEDATIEEVREAASIAGCEGFAILTDSQKILKFEWFVQ